MSSKIKFCHSICQVSKRPNLTQKVWKYRNMTEVTEGKKRTEWRYYEKGSINISIMNFCCLYRSAPTHAAMPPPAPWRRVHSALKASAVRTVRWVKSLLPFFLFLFFLLWSSHLMWYSPLVDIWHNTNVWTSYCSSKKNLIVVLHF